MPPDVFLPHTSHFALAALQSIIDEGCWEYNSRPYSAYFFLAVMALADAAEERLRAVARRVCVRVIHGRAVLTSPYLVPLI